IETIWDTVRNNLQTVIWLSFLKLIALPLCVYFLFKVFYPSYAIAALLLTGISTGVVAPFISTLVKANVNLVLVMVVISSPLVPFTLPALVKILLGRSIEISLLGMMRILCMVIFVPILAVEVLRRITPGMLDSIMKRRYPISLVIFAIINLGVFSRYSDFFYQNPLTILEATFVAILLGGIYLVVGISALWKGPTENQLASAISLGNMNNVLVLVFASEFFTPLEPTVAAMYMIPFFGLILPLRIYQRLRKDYSPR
ncbi:MAG: bile acid:sodium symporter, partial [Deltaproteobacteria bacterium]|nr:bile acid:sodium symporter [Deltaproteobacteria bacterium]